MGRGGMKNSGMGQGRSEQSGLKMGIHLALELGLRGGWNITFQLHEIHDQVSGGCISRSLFCFL